MAEKPSGLFRTYNVKYQKFDVELSEWLYIFYRKQSVSGTQFVEWKKKVPIPNRQD